MITFIFFLFVYWLWLRPNLSSNRFSETLFDPIEEYVWEEGHETRGREGRQFYSHRNPEIIFFTSNVVGDVLVQNDFLVFSWQVKNAIRIILITECESFDVTHLSHFQLRFVKSQQVLLEAENKYGKRDTKKLAVQVAEFHKFDKVIPFPVIVHHQFTHFGIPPIPSISPPKLSILEHSLAFTWSLDQSIDQVVAVAAIGIDDRHST